MIIEEKNGITVLSNVKEEDIVNGEFVIPDSVTSISSGAFTGCRNLISIIIPPSVTSIGLWAFAGCSSLTRVVISDSVISIDDEVFYDCCSLTNVVIPDSVTTIGDAAFFGCSNLTHVVIPDSVTSIGDKAFYDCGSLISIVIPDSVNFIANMTFDFCFSLNHIFINTKDNTHFNKIKAFLPEELKEKIIDFNIVSQVQQLKKQILIDANLACHPLQSLPSSQRMNFLVRNVLDFDLGHSLEPIHLLKKKLEAQPIECHTPEEFEAYKQQLNQIHLDFQLQLTHQNLKAYLNVLEKQIPRLFFSSTPKQIEKQKTWTVFRLITRLIDSLEKNEDIQVSEEERDLLLEKPLLLSKIPKDIQDAMGIIKEKSPLRLT